MLIYKDGLVADFREIFKNTSFSSSGPSDEFLSENGAIKVNVFKPHNVRTHKLITCAPYIENGWAYTVAIEAKTQEELDSDATSESANVRSTRNKMLSECDWTQLADAPVDKTAWAAYRQALRDLTNQSGFPWDITWPTKPE